MRKLLTIALLLLGTTAFAQNPYGGLAIGQTKAKDFCDEAARLRVSCDDTDTAWKIFAGAQFNRNFAIELGYTDLGELSVSAGSVRATVEATAFEIVGVGIVPIAEKLSVFAKLGMYRATTEARSNFGFSADETNNDVTFGFGARIDPAANFGAFAQWQRYADVGGGALGEDDVDVISFGVLVRF